MRLLLSILSLVFILTACNQKPESLMENDVTEALPEIYISKETQIFMDLSTGEPADGFYKSDYTEGAKRAEITFEDGFPADGNLWDEEGNLLLTVSKEKELYVQTRYYPNGNRHRKIVLENGVFGIREIKAWYEDGHPQVEHNDEVIRNWYPGGQMESEAHFRDGTLHGRTAIWHENGQLAGECFYVDGELDGAYVEWDEEGNVVTDKLYESGELIAESL